MIPSCTASTTDSSELVYGVDYLLPNVTGDGTLHLSVLQEHSVTGGR